MKIWGKSVVEHANTTYAMMMLILFVTVKNPTDMGNTPCPRTAVSAGRTRKMSKGRASKQNGIRAQIGRQYQTDVYKFNPKRMRKGKK